MTTSGQEPERLEAKFEKKTRKDGSGRAWILLDGAELGPDQVHLAFVSRFGGSSDSCEISLGADIVAHILDDAVAEAVRALRFDDLGRSLGVVSLAVSAPWNLFLNRFYLVRRSKNEGAWGIVFFLKIWPDQWAFPFTVDEYEGALSAAAPSEGFECVDPWDFTCLPDSSEDEGRSGTLWELAFLLASRSSANTIADEVAYASERLRLVDDRAVRYIMAGRRDALVSFFTFPAPYKAACEQYLFYFIQFLEDLGIDAEAETKQHAGELMFSVVPKDGPSALEKIRTALQIYLRLPAQSETMKIAAEFQDVAVAQLRANVLFLQSQLELSRAVLQAKDAAIDSLNLVTFQQRQLLTSSTSSINPSLATPRAPEEERLFGDSISITPYEGKGFRVNLPLLLRRLKRAWSATRD